MRISVRKLFDKPVPGWHGKGGYTGQGRIVITNNGRIERIDDAGGQKVIRVLVPLAELFGYARAERRYAAEGLGVVGNYHSHPDHPAVPSQYDLEHLAPWPTMSYVVVSVREGKAADLRSWELEADRSRFNEEEIEEA